MTLSVLAEEPGANGANRMIRRECMTRWAHLLSPRRANSSRKPDLAKQSPAAGALLQTRYSYSADGRYDVFLSGSQNLVPGQIDASGNTDVFLDDRVTGANVLVSRTAGSPTTASNQSAFVPVIRAGGRWVTRAS